MRLSYPEDLPVSRHRETIREAFDANQVIIVCGDTGSGKTTQLPKIALESDRARNANSGKITKRIGCTQPRRIAATSVARRVAEELQVELGKEVGYQIRFEDRTDQKTTAVKFMTDGILLAETRGDPNLHQYGTLIIDEAHERSLNIDFILGYLHRLLPKRRDLRVIISSATLDADSFSQFFGGAPVISVEGRTFPVEDLYHPPHFSTEPTAKQIARAAEWLAGTDPFGDTLVFLPGEREIKEAAELLEGRRYPNTAVLPLFARLAGDAQQAVFKPAPTTRRIILATNIAETSLTIPDIRSVIDTGVARVNRFDPRTGIQRLLVEPISKASARQRRGRCGRVSDGICIRLYDEEDFEDRKEFTDPEILRSNLAGVVLQMEHLGLGDPLQFPFVDKPQPKRIAQAYQTLEEIGALWKKGSHSGLTEVGETLARLPLDPRVGRILIAAQDEGCLREGLIVASALTVQDPRERPQEKQEQAGQAHAQFRDNRSDFTGWLRWWHAIQRERKSSNNSVRRFAKKNFLNYRRTQEWLNLHRELRSVLRDLRWKLPDPNKPIADPAGTYHEPLHRAILAGIPSHIGLKNAGKASGYKGARDSNFFLFPGSGLFKSAPAWVMAFEIVETARLYARDSALFDPASFEKVAPHLCRYRYSKPHWVAENGAVYGEETVVAFGLPIIEKRRVHYGRIDPKTSRDIFILEALVNGETRSPLPQLAQNRETIEAAGRLEHKLRRRGGLIHPNAVYEFYDERVPPDIHTQKAFEKWAAKNPPETLTLTLEDCIVPLPEPVDPDKFPDELPAPDDHTSFTLTYLHNPEDDADGITLHIPLADLPHLPEYFGDWLVPGWLPEKADALFRTLPKDWRGLLPPRRQLVDTFLDQWEGYIPHCTLLEAILEFLQTEHGVQVPANVFDLTRIPTHLRMRFQILGDDGRTIASGRDLSALQENLAPRVKERFTDVARGQFDIPKVESWSFGTLPDSVELDRRTAGFPALAETHKTFPSLKLFPSAECAAHHHRHGVAQLYRALSPTHIAALEKTLFTPASQSQIPKPATARPKPKSNSKTDSFNSLSNLFGDPTKGGRVSQPATKAMVPSKATAPPKTSPSLPSLTTDHILQLSQIGPDPKRNRSDLVTRILLDSLGSPRSESDWSAAFATPRPIFFQNAARRTSQLSQILDILIRIEKTLTSPENAYAESIADAKEHLDLLLCPGWLLDENLARRVVDFRGLELRVTRMFGSPAAKDLAKLERHHAAAAGIWSDDSPCPCTTCFPAPAFMENRERDLDSRLHTFAQELRRN